MRTKSELVTFLVLISISILSLLCVSNTLYFPLTDYVFGSSMVTTPAAQNSVSFNRARPLNVIISNRTSIFSVDYVPRNYSKSLKAEYDPVHFCVVAAQMRIAEEVKVLVKSIILHSRRSDVYFHFLLYEGSEYTVPNIFNEINCAFTNIYYDFVYVDLRIYMNKMFNSKVQTSSARFSGIYGLGKLFVYDIMKHVEECLIVDTDVVFAVDTAILWSEMQPKLKTGAVIAVAKDSRPKIFNSGVMMQNLSLMRKMKFESLITLDKFCNKRIVHNETVYTCIHDQDILNRIQALNASLFTFFSNSWNLGKCLGFAKFDFSRHEQTDMFFGAAHFSCMSATVESAFDAFVIDDRYQKQFHHLPDYIRYLKELRFITSSENKCYKTNTLENITYFKI